MKSGTTWVVNNLREHPDIHFTYEKEIGYFAYHHADRSQFVMDRGYRIGKTRIYIKYIPDDLKKLKDYHQWCAYYLDDPVDDNWYKKLFFLNKGCKYNADFSNLSAHLSADGWKHVKQIARNVKLLFVMRDPVERLWSHMRFQLQLDNKLDHFDFSSKDAVRAFCLQDHIWRNSLYSNTIKRISENFSDDDFLLLFFEDIKTAPKACLLDIENFLQIEHIEYDDEALKKKVNPSLSVQKPSFFADLFAEELQKEVSSLKSYGLVVPTRWTL